LLPIKQLLSVMKQLSGSAKIYIALTVLAGAALLCISVPMWTSGQTLRFVLYLAAALLASNLKVALPGITGTMSVNFVFVLIAVMDLNLPQVLAIGYAGAAGQVLIRAKSRAPVRLVFNLASTAISVSCCYFVYHSSWLREVNGSVPVLLFFSAAALFLVNTLSVSGVIALAERKNLWEVWNEGFLWTGSHHLVGAGVAAVFHMGNRYLGWEAAVLTLPVVYFVYRSYSLHLGRLDVARKHASELGGLHWRAIEALALAIDAKDETTHNHLLRVKVYATEIGKELKLDDLEMQAVQAAALLHDIGKLAVPDYIISKPGKLTREEFEKMKVHPVVGAEILEQVRFPYPVVPIVRFHHEKWNGKGYPAGLKGEQIPIGARILAAVDCLDALASDRQYRRALPLDEAMAVVAGESGISFDPRIVEILQCRYVELEHMATSARCPDERKLSTNVRVEAGGGPASGYAEARESLMPADQVSSIAAARQDFSSLMRTIDDLGGSLSVHDTLLLLTSRLNRMVPHDLAVIFVRDGKRLLPTYVSNEDDRWFARGEIPVGQGLTGWVVENRKPIVNGNPAVEPGYPRTGEGGSLLSAISIPLEASGEAIGALTFYSKEANAFTNDHLWALLGISPAAGVTLATALKHRQAVADEQSAANLPGHGIQEVGVGFGLT
jgi:putative nucleotidyltransferase with HDIG domain